MLENPLTQTTQPPPTEATASSNPAIKMPETKQDGANNTLEAAIAEKLEPISTPKPKPKRKRLPFLDNIKVFLTMVVILFHVWVSVLFVDEPSPNFPRKLIVSHALSLTLPHA